MADMDKMAKDRLGPLLARLGLGLVVVYHAYGRITHGGGSAWHFSMPPTAQLLYFGNALPHSLWGTDTVNRFKHLARLQRQPIGTAYISA